MPKTYNNNVFLKFATGSNVEVNPPEYQQITGLDSGGASCSLVVSPQVLNTASGNVSITGSTGSFVGTYRLLKNGIEIATYTQSQNFSIASDAVTANTTYVLEGPAGSGCNPSRQVLVAAATSCSLTVLSGPDSSGNVTVRAVAGNTPGLQYEFFRSASGPGSTLVLTNTLLAGQTFNFSDNVSPIGKRYTLDTNDANNTCFVQLDVPWSEPPPAGCPPEFFFGINTAPPFYSGQTITIGANGIQTGETYTVSISPPVIGFPVYLTEADPNADFVINTTGNYTLFYANDDSSCAGSREIIVTPVPTCSMVQLTTGPIYPGSAVRYQVTSGPAGTYFFNNGLGAGTATYTGLSAGFTFEIEFLVPIFSSPDTYTASWSNGGAGCSVSDDYVVIEEPVTVGCSLTPPSGFLWSNPTPAGSQVDVRVRTGSTAGTYTLSSTPSGLVSGSFGPLADTIVTFTAPSESSPNTVTVSISGPSGCSETETFNVSAVPVQCDLTVSSSSVNEGEDITLTVNPGTFTGTYTLSSSFGGSFSQSSVILNTPNVSSSPITFTAPLVSETRNIVLSATSGAGCGSNETIQVIDVPASSPLTLSISGMSPGIVQPGNTTDGCVGVLSKSKTLTIGGGSGSYTVTVNSAVDVIGNYSSPSIATSVTNLSPGQEDLTVSLSGIACGASSADSCPLDGSISVSITVVDDADPANTITQSTTFGYVWNQCLQLGIS